ncbi:MAG: MOSC domain-containing protein [bacterium]|nr:MOSC domain-containing protein [bacterium]
MSTWQGEVVSIHTAPAAGEAMTDLQEVEALAGRGLAGDRYAKESGTHSKAAGPHRHVTFIESEVLESLKRDDGIELPGVLCRRNIVTRGVQLMGLVGKEFKVGGVTFRGVRLNEPCRYFQNLVQIEGVVKALVHRSGLNAEVVAGGRVRVGDRMGE